MTESMSTTVCVAGGGPAGAMLGLLLARSGVDVVVLEKHADFHRDFRGDTVHPATLQILDEIGLMGRFNELPHQKVSTIGVVQDGRRINIADFRRLRVRYPYMAFVPQWDFLDLITREAARYPSFGLMMRTEALDVLRDGDRVVGVRARGPQGEVDIRSTVVIAADGRHSAIRSAVGVTPQLIGRSLDVIFFRLSRRDTDPDEGICVRIGNGKIFGATDRRTYWQMSYETTAGGMAKVRNAGLDVFRADLAEMVPFLADRVHEVSSYEDLSLLEARIDRLDRWHRPGLLFIGDAAHAMSPVAGFGVNLAVQDAVAVANALVAPLLQAQQTGAAFDDARLAAIQRRRQLPTKLSQGLQRATQRFGIDNALNGSGQPPAPKLFEKLGAAQWLMSRIIGLGFRPEHVLTPAADPVRTDPTTDQIKPASERQDQRMDPQQQMMSMITGYWGTQVVRTLAELGIADHLANGPRTSAELAELTACDPEAMSRFLRACAAQQLVHFRPDGTFETTPMLAMLREGVPHTLREIAIVHGSPGHWLPWGRLPDAVRSGVPQTTAALGVDIWGHFAANPVEFGRFINSMTELTAGLADQIAELLDVTGVGVAVDVGGANGSLLHAVLQSAVDVRGVLLDLPDVAATATVEAEKAGLADRVTVVGGSFFDPIPAGDLLLLKAVLHNWDDEACVRILTNCRAALNPGGRLVVVEMPLSPMGEPGFTPLHDLNMLTVVSGRERDLDHYDTLFAAAGLRRTGVTPTRSPQCLIEAVTA